MTSVSAKEQPVQIVTGGNFKIARLTEEHLVEDYRLHKYDTLNLVILGLEGSTQGEGDSGDVNVNSSFGNIFIGVDGYAQVPYIGNLKLVGYTIEEATEILQKGLSKYLKIPKLSLAVKSYGPRRICVIGEVRSPGVKDMGIDNMNVYSAIASAGGIAKRARPKHVQVLRPVEGTLYYREVNLDDFIKKHDLAQNIALEDGDIVYVPRSNKIIFEEDIAPYISIYSVYKTLTR